jgi:hypothetical protein
MSVSVSFLNDFVVQEMKHGKLCESLAILDRRTSDLVSPRFEGNFLIKKFPGYHREQVLIELSFLSWYLDDTWRPLVQLWLASQVKYLNPDARVKLRCFLSNRLVALSWSADSTSFRSLKGNKVDLWKKILDNLKPKFPGNRKVRKKTFRRGYDDHGCLRPSHRWLPDSDVSLVEEQNLIEEERELDESLIQFIEGWFL